MLYPAGKITIGDTDYSIAVDSLGRWQLEVQPIGEFLMADTRAGLRDKLVASRRKAELKLDIPFAMEHGREIVQGRVTGVHSTTGNYLVKWDTGGKGQVRTHEAFLVGLSRVDVDHFLGLLKTKRDVDDAVYRWRRDHRLDMTAAVATWCTVEEGDS